MGKNARKRDRRQAKASLANVICQQVEAIPRREAKAIAREDKARQRRLSMLVANAEKWHSIYAKSALPHVGRAQCKPKPRLVLTPEPFNLKRRNGKLVGKTGFTTSSNKSAAIRGETGKDVFGTIRLETRNDSVIVYGVPKTDLEYFGKVNGMDLTIVSDNSRLVFSRKQWEQEIMPLLERFYHE